MINIDELKVIMRNKTKSEYTSLFRKKNKKDYNEIIKDCDLAICKSDKLYCVIRGIKEIPLCSVCGFPMKLDYEKGFICNPECELTKEDNKPHFRK